MVTEQLTSTLPEAPGAYAQEDVVTLDGLREEARERGRLSGPSRETQQPYFDFTDDSVLKLTHNSGPEAEVFREVTGAYNKLVQRTGQEDSAVNIALPKQLAEEIHEIGQILGLDEGKKINLQAARQLATFQSSDFARKFFGGEVTEEYLSQVNSPERAQQIRNFLTKNRLTSFAVTAAADPRGALERFIIYSDKLLEQRPALASSLNKRYQDVDMLKVLTPDRLMTLAFSQRSDPFGALETKFDEHDLLAKKFAEVPDWLIWEASFGTTSHAFSGERQLNLAQQSYREHRRPDNIPQSAWWRILYNARGNSKTITDRIGEYNAHVIRDQNKRIGESPARPEFTKISELTKSNPNELNEVLLMHEWGSDLMKPVVSFLESDPNQAREMLFSIREIRQGTAELGRHLSRITGDPEMAKAFEKGFNRRTAELAFFGASPGEDNQRRLALPVIAEAVRRIEKFFVSNETLHIQHGSPTYTSNDGGLSITIRHGSRIGFTVKASEELCASLRAKGLNLPEPLKAPDRNINVRLDYDTDQLTLDIGNSDATNNTFLGKFVGSSLDKAHAAVLEYRRQHGIRIPPRLARQHDTGGHHTAEHFTESRFTDKTHMKHITSSLTSYLRGRLPLPPRGS